MIVREYIKCLICDTPYCLRVGVGYDPYQRHFFDCINCELPIGIAVRANPPYAHVETVENCIITKDNEGIVYNLHPNFSFEQNKLHDPQFFASLESFSIIQKHIRFREGKFQDISVQFDVINAPALWNNLKSIIKLDSKKTNEEALKKQLEAYSKKRSLYGDNSTISNKHDAAINFIDSLFYPRVNEISKPIIEKIATLEEHPDYARFITFYKEHLLSENQERYLSTLTDYFKYRDNFGQLIYHARVNNDDIKDRVIGSKNLDEIKLFYGQAYETLTSHFTIFACINNMLDGRRFDEFKMMPLKKYMSLDKARRHECFENKEFFKPFIEGLDSTLRNGTHHASVWRDGEIIYFRTGGTGAERSISYSEYIHICNKLTISISALFIIELELQRLIK
ncbi:hypothetical protein [Aeromonas sp. 604176]|uniref:hypothetical protein n=1 Tax=Aeromonas sp. 604176 TaxID=2712052 RepID=UPI003BA230D5